MSARILRLLGDLAAPRRRLLAQEREIAALRRELDALRARVENMQSGMRRCISCEYKLAFRNNPQRVEESPWT